MDTHTIIIVSLLGDQERDFSFTQWPNHITVMPYFQVADINSLVTEVKNACAQIHQIPFLVGAADYFGVEKNVTVSTIIPNQSLDKLHRVLLVIAQQNDPNMETQFCGPNYRPHITHNDMPFPQEGESGKLKKLYIIENKSRFTGEKRLQVKEILQVIDLAA